jgi:FlaA1/EpsC-like NDP-sugar epimerase
MVLWALEHAQGGEIFVPKLPSYRILDVAEAVAPECEHRIVGIRPGEKIHEDLITESDGWNSVDLGPYYAVLPALPGNDRRRYAEARGGSLVPEGFAYNSGTNSTFLTVDELRALIGRHIDPPPEVLPARVAATDPR